MDKDSDTAEFNRLSQSPATNPKRLSASIDRLKASLNRPLSPENSDDTFRLPESQLNRFDDDDRGDAMVDGGDEGGRTATEFNPPPSSNTFGYSHSKSSFDDQLQGSEARNDDIVRGRITRGSVLATRTNFANDNSPAPNLMVTPSADYSKSCNKLKTFSIRNVNDQSDFYTQNSQARQHDQLRNIRYPGRTSDGQERSRATSDDRKFISQFIDDRSPGPHIATQTATGNAFRNYQCVVLDESGKKAATSRSIQPQLKLGPSFLQMTGGIQSGMANTVGPAGSLTPNQKQQHQDQIRQLKKLMWHKEAEFSKDKARWIQKYDLSEKELQETRERLESQKKYYCKIIQALKMTNSPSKSPVLNFAPRHEEKQKESPDKEDSMIQESIANAKTNIDQILLQEKIQDEIDMKAKQIARDLAEHMSKDMINELKSKLEEYEQQIKLNEQYQIEYDYKDGQKTNIIKTLQSKLDSIENTFQNENEQLHRQVSAMENEVKQAEEASKKAIQEASNQKTELESQIQRLSQINQQSLEQIQIYNSQLLARTADENAGELNLVKKQELIETLILEKQERQSEINQQDEKIKSFESVNKELQVKLQDIEAEKDRLAQQFQKSRELLEDLSKEMIQLRNDLAESEDNCQKLENQVKNLKMQSKSNGPQPIATNSSLYKITEEDTFQETSRSHSSQQLNYPMNHTILQNLMRRSPSPIEDQQLTEVYRKRIQDMQQSQEQERCSFQKELLEKDATILQLTQKLRRNQEDGGSQQEMHLATIKSAPQKVGSPRNVDNVGAKLQRRRSRENRRKQSEIASSDEMAENSFASSNQERNSIINKETKNSNAILYQSFGKDIVDQQIQMISAKKGLQIDGEEQRCSFPPESAGLKVKDFNEAFELRGGSSKWNEGDQFMPSGPLHLCIPEPANIDSDSSPYYLSHNFTEKQSPMLINITEPLSQICSKVQDCESEHPRRHVKIQIQPADENNFVTINTSNCSEDIKKQIECKNGQNGNMSDTDSDPQKIEMELFDPGQSKDDNYAIPQIESDSASSMAELGLQKCQSCSRFDQNKRTIGPRLQNMKENSKRQLHCQNQQREDNDFSPLLPSSFGDQTTILGSQISQRPAQLFEYERRVVTGSHGNASISDVSAVENDNRIYTDKTQDASMMQQLVDDLDVKSKYSKSGISGVSSQQVEQLNLYNMQIYQKLHGEKFGAGLSSGVTKDDKLLDTTVMTSEDGKARATNHQAYLEERGQFTFQKQKQNQSITMNSNEVPKQRHKLFINVDEREAPSPFNPENVQVTEVNVAIVKKKKEASPNAARSAGLKIRSRNTGGPGAPQSQRTQWVSAKTKSKAAPAAKPKNKLFDTTIGTSENDGSRDQEAGSPHNYPLTAKATKHVQQFSLHFDAVANKVYQNRSRQNQARQSLSKSNFFTSQTSSHTINKTWAKRSLPGDSDVSKGSQVLASSTSVNQPLKSPGKKIFPNTLNTQEKQAEGGKSMYMQALAHQYNKSMPKNPCYTCRPDNETRRAWGGHARTSHNSKRQLLFQNQGSQRASSQNQGKEKAEQDAKQNVRSHKRPAANKDAPGRNTFQARKMTGGPNTKKILSSQKSLDFSSNEALPFKSLPSGSRCLKPLKQQSPSKQAKQGHSEKKASQQTERPLFGFSNSEINQLEKSIKCHNTSAMKPAVGTSDKKGSLGGSQSQTQMTQPKQHSLATKQTLVGSQLADKVFRKFDLGLVQQQQSDDSCEI